MCQAVPYSRTLSLHSLVSNPHFSWQVYSQWRIICFSCVKTCLYYCNKFLYSYKGSHNACPCKWSIRVHTCPWHPQCCNSFHWGAEKTGVPTPMNIIAIPPHLEISEAEMKISSFSSCFMKKNPINITCNFHFVRNKLETKKILRDHSSVC